MNESSLSCRQVLVPPARSLMGGGSACLTYTPRQPAWECTFSRDGLLLAVAYGAPNPVVRVWKLVGDTWKLHATLASIHDKTVRSVAFAPCAGVKYVLASASFDGTVAIWEPSDPHDTTEWISTAQLEGHEKEVKSVRWNATGSLLATCGRDQSIWIWECFLEGMIGGGGGPGDAEFECLAVLNGHEGDVKCVRFADSHGEWGDGDEILLSSGYDGYIKLWAADAGDWYCAATLSRSAVTIWSLAVAPSGARLYAGFQDGSLLIYKCYTRQEKRSLQLCPDDGNNEEDDPQLGLWKCVGKLPEAHGAQNAVYSVDIAPAKVGHGRIVSGGGDHGIQILREVPGSSSDQPKFVQEVAITTDHGDVHCVTWHPTQGSLLASTGDDGFVRIWNFSIGTSPP